MVTMKIFHILIIFSLAIINFPYQLTPAVPADSLVYQSHSIVTPEIIISEITPSYIVAGSGDTNIIITGSGYSESTEVFYDGAAIGYAFIDSMHMSAIIPSYYMINPGLASISVIDNEISASIDYQIYPRTDTWMQSSPEGGEVHDIVIDPQNPSILYAATHEAGVFKSVDSGEHWFRSSNGISSAGGMIAALAISPDNSNLVIASGDGTYRSTNAGETWTKVLLAGTLTDRSVSLRFHESIPNLVLLGTEIGLYRSVDGGKTWQEIIGEKLGTVELSVISSVAIDAYDPLVFYVIKSQTTYPENILWKTADGGNTWHQISGGWPEGRVQSIVADPITSGVLYATAQQGSLPNAGIFKSLDGGETWSQVLSSADDFYKVCINPINPQDVLVAAGDGILRTQNGGTDWSLIDTGISTYNSITAINVNPNDPALLYFGNKFGISRSTDSGANWMKINRGLTAQKIHNLAYAQGTHTLYASTESGGYWTSSDYGLSWEQHFIKDGYYKGPTFSVDPNNPLHLITGTIRESVDGGLTWSDAWSESGDYVAFASNSDIYRSSHGEVFRSTDNGATWVDISPTIDDYGGSVYSEFLIADVIDPNTVYLLTTTIAYSPDRLDFSLFFTNDGGITWNNPITYDSYRALHSLAIDPSNPSILYLSTSQSVMKSIDGGYSWAETGLFYNIPVNATAVDPLNSQLIYAGTQGFGVYRSQDGGANWSQYNYGLSGGNVYSVVAIPDIPASSPDTAEEGVTATASSLKSRVIAINSGQLYSFSQVNYPPTNIMLSKLTVEGHLPVGTLVGTFKTTDANSTDTFSYTFEDKAGCVDNASFSISQAKLLTNEVFDKDIKSAYKVCIRSTDNRGLHTIKEFIISIPQNHIPPPAPKLYKPANNAPGIRSTPTFYWYASKGANGYQIQIDDDLTFSEPPFYQSGVLGSLSHKPTSVLSVGQWYWRVRARDSAGAWSEWSEVRLLTILPPIPKSPTLLRPLNGNFINDSTPQFIWNPGIGAVSYELQVSKNQSFTAGSLIINEQTSDLYYTMTSPLREGAHFWRVRGINSAGEFGSWSKVSQFVYARIYRYRIQN
jgi:photosystem II stability/assembly factor-like uncharacterized protein